MRILNLKSTRNLLLDKFLRLHDGIWRYCTLCFSVTNIESMYSYSKLSDDHRTLGIFRKRIMRSIYTCVCIQSCYYFHHEFNAEHPIVSNIGFSIRKLRDDRVGISVKCAEEQSVYCNYVYAWKRLLFIFTSDNT